MTIAKITLAEKRADALALDTDMKRHATQCTRCVKRSRCAEWKEMQASLKTMQDIIRHSFDPGPDDEALF
jgi:hypothetical protein